jgi:hypothetical protein
MTASMLLRGHRFASGVRSLPLGSAVFGLLLASTLIFGAPAAEGIVKYKSLTSIGPVAEPSNIAVAQAHDYVYTAAIGENVIDEFAPKGSDEYELTGQLSGTETPQISFVMHAGEPAPVAIDGASGDIYVADPGHFVVDKFSSAGKYLCQLSGYGRGCLPNPEVELGSAPTFGELTGVAVDSHGNVYIGDYTNGVVDEFTSAGANVKQISGCGIEHPSGIAFDPSGVMYVQNYFSDVVTATCPSGSVLDPEQSYDIAVDPLGGEVFVDHGPSISVFGPSPTNPLLYKISIESAESRGVAVYNSGAARRLYVSDPTEGKVLVFEGARVPDVRLSGTPSVEAFGAKVTGEIEPEGTAGASYHFDYGPPRGVLGESSASTAVPAVTEYLPAESHLGGLLPNTEYGYRLVGTNNSELSDESSEGTFKTSTAKPEVSEVTTLDLTASSVIFSGAVNPENSPPATYHFEYEAEGCDESTPACKGSLPAIGIDASSTSPIPVEQSLPAGVALKPGTVYRYRLVAENYLSETTLGRTESTTQTFTTSAAPPAGGQPLVSTGPAVSVSQNGATLTGTVDPEGLPTTYEFELGVASNNGVTSYGVLLLGGEAGSAQGEGPVALPIGGLQPGSVYHFRIVALNADGRVTGADQAFATTTFPGVAQPASPSILQTPTFPAVESSPLIVTPTVKVTEKHRKHKKKAKAKSKRHASAGKHRRAAKRR